MLFFIDNFINSILEISHKSFRITAKTNIWIAKLAIYNMTYSIAVIKSSKIMMIKLIRNFFVNLVNKYVLLGITPY